MNAIDRKRLVQRLERDADAEAWADEFLYKHPKFIAGIVYYANRMLEEIESGAFDIKSPEVPTFKVGDRVRHKTERALILGEITGFSKTGKSAFVKWIDYDKKVYWFGSPGMTYRIDKLEKVEDDGR